MMLKNKNAVIYGTVVLFRRTAVTMPLAAVAEEAAIVDEIEWRRHIQRHFTLGS
jgi:hypothetical protein